MGAGCSRCRTDRRGSSRPPTARRRASDGRVDSDEPHRSIDATDDRLEAMERLRDEFRHRPTVFLVSQILFTVQFFKNFDSDRLRVYQLKQDKEKELNKRLRKDKKSAIYLGSPYEVIGEVMAYSREEGAEPSLGHDLQYLIVHDSVSVRSPFDPPDDDDKTDYQLITKESKRDGYTRLRLTGRIRPPGADRRRAESKQNGDAPGGQAEDQTPEHDIPEARRGGNDKSAAPVSSEGRNGPTVSGCSSNDQENIESSRQKPDRSPTESRRNGSKPSGNGDSQTDGQPHATKTPNASKSLLGQPDSDKGPRDSWNSGKSAMSSRSSDSSRRRHGSSSSLDTDHEEARDTITAMTSKSQGKGQAFLNDLRRKLDGDKVQINLSDEEITDSNGDDASSNEQTAGAAQTQNVGMGSSKNSKKMQRHGPEQSENNLNHHPSSKQTGHTHPGKGTLPVFPGVYDPNHNIWPATPWQQPTPNNPNPFDAQFPSSNTTKHLYRPLMKAQVPPPAQATSFPLPVPQASFPGHGAVPHIVFIPPPPPGLVQHPEMPMVFQPAIPAVIPSTQPDMNPFDSPSQPGLPPQQYPAHPYQNGFLPPQTAIHPYQNGYPGMAPCQSGMYPFPNGFLPPQPQMPPTNLVSSADAGRRSLRPISERQESSGFLRPPPTGSGQQQRQRRRQGRGRRREGSSSSADSRRPSSTSSKVTLLESTTTEEELDTPGRIPKQCFLKVKEPVDEDDDPDTWVMPQYQMRRYLASDRFLTHFVDHFSEVARLLGLESTDGRWQLRKGSLHVPQRLADGLRCTVRVTPTLLSATWPAEFALEWGLRRRPQRLDMRRRLRYVWPPDRVVQSVQEEVGCNLLPLGPDPRDWEIGFQQAEVVLIGSLDLVHVHCWAVAKLFFTHFLAEFGCLQERHIRHMMFWQFERNFRDWRLETLGTSLIEFLTMLKESVQQRQLEHYFIRRRNLLRSESTGSLVSALERIQRVMENLLPNIIILMSRLEVRNNAFPTFDWKALYENLRMSTTDIMKKLIPELATEFSSRDSLMFNPQMAADDDDDTDEAWNLTRRQQIEAKYRRWKQQQKQQRKRRRPRAPPPTPSGPLPSFAGLGQRLHTLGERFQPRTEIVLQLFIKHFSAMAERLLEHDSIDTAFVYIDHSLNLCTLLEEEGGAAEAGPLQERLSQLEAAALAKLPAPEEEAEQVDTDLLPLAAEVTGREATDNWTVGQTNTTAVRRDYNREAAAAAVSGDAAERAVGGAAVAEEVFGGDAGLGEIRVNPAFVADIEEEQDSESQMSREEDEESDGDEEMKQERRSSQTVSQGDEGKGKEEEDGYIEDDDVNDAEDQDEGNKDEEDEDAFQGEGNNNVGDEEVRTEGAAIEGDEGEVQAEYTEDSGSTDKQMNAWESIDNVDKTMRWLEANGEDIRRGSLFIQADGRGDGDENKDDQHTQL